MIRLKQLFRLSAILCVFNLGCEVSTSSSLETRSSTTETRSSTTFSSGRLDPSEAGTAGQQQVFQAKDVTYIIAGQPIRLKQDLDPMLDKLRTRRGLDNTLVCAQTVEIEGLFLCGGTSRAAQHIPLMRAAIYAEARPSIGVPLGGQVVPMQLAASAYQLSYGHDLPQALLQDFFSKAKSSCPDLSCLLEGEKLFASKVMREFQNRVPSGYSVVSFDVESEQSVRGALKHEIAHGQFFQQKSYRNAVQAFWVSLPPEVREAAQVVLGMNYDPTNQQLIMNEFHAYILDGSYSDITPERIAAATEYDQRMGAALEIIAFNSQLLNASLRSLIQSAGQQIWAGSL